MFSTVNQPIQVAAVFKNGQLKPLKFLWQGREFSVRAVNLSYSRYEGRSKLYFFAVNDKSNFFKLEFNSDSLAWTLLECYTE
jgi:hypothetical protein